MEITKSSEWSFWDYCPTEILCLILSKVEPTTLLICMQVNNRWRQNAKFVAQFYGKWKKIVEEKLADNGVIYNRKSILDWRDLYKNSILWRFVHESDVILKRVYNGTRIKNGSVYKDNLIVVDETARYYGIAEGNVRRILSSFAWQSDGTVPDGTSIEETDYLLVVYKKERYFVQLIMYGKISADDVEANMRTPKTERNVLMHVVDEERCYIIRRIDFYTIEVVVNIWNRIDRSFKFIILGTFGCVENGLAAMHACRDTIKHLYIIRKCGKVLKCQTTEANGPIENIFRLNVPFYAVYGPVFTFHKYNAVLRACEGMEFKVTYNKKWDNMVIECPKLSCVTDHGNVLFLGRTNGKVDIYLKRKLKMGNCIPEKRIDLMSFQEFDRNHKEVLWVNVHESNHSHHLFIGTRVRVFQIILTHSPLNKFFYD